FTGYERRRQRPAGPRAPALRAALASPPGSGSAACGCLLRPGGQLHTRAWQTGGELDLARRSQRRLLVHVGAFYPVDRLALAAFPFRASGPGARVSDSPALGLAVFVRAHCGHGGGSVVALRDASVSVVGRGQALRADELRLGDDDV